MTLHTILKTKLVADGFTAADIFLHHSDQTERDYILINSAGNSPRSQDGLKDFFKDIYRIRTYTFGPKDTNTIEAALTQKDLIIASLADTHLTDEIVFGELLNDPEPIHEGTSKCWVWNSTFRFTGSFC